jgi:hypothetical protein
MLRRASDFTLPVEIRFRKREGRQGSWFINTGVNYRYDHVSAGKNQAPLSSA